MVAARLRASGDRGRCGTVYCGRPEKGDMSAQVKILYNSDSISGPEPADSVRNKVNARKKGGKDGKNDKKRRVKKKSFPKEEFS